MAHSNEELLRRQDDALKAGDMETFWGTFAPTVVMHVGGRSPLAGTYKGIDQLQEAFVKWMSLCDSLEIITHDIVANDHHGVALQSYRAKRGNKSFEGNGVSVTHLEDGKIVEAWQFDEDQAAEAEFYS